MTSFFQQAFEFAVLEVKPLFYDRIAMRFRQETNDDISFLKSGIETRNRAFNQLIEQIERVAIRSVDPVLLTGPTGAGKSNLARRVYELKKCRRPIEAGRKIFAVSREKKSKTNDADRLRKYLNKYGIRWEDV